jgi:hypothetical protein
METMVSPQDQSTKIEVETEPHELHESITLNDHVEVNASQDHLEAALSHQEKSQKDLDDESKYPGPVAVALLMVAISMAMFLVSLVCLS